jgi:uncharacterized protein (DUF1684 family)
MIILSSCSEEKTNSKYIEDITKYRDDVKDFFINSEDSPVVDMTDKIIPEYYSPKEEYKVEAYLEEFSEKDTFEMLTTQSDVRNMIRYGEITFKLDDEKFTLTAYVNIEYPDSFFIPFHDETNGNETYEAGRYLDLEITEQNKYILDFNLAYNPYCYYNAKYSCPIVPADNNLNTKIEAGEKAHNESH